MIVLPLEVHTSNNPNPCFTEVTERNSATRRDLVEHIW
jgi:hypothetical protein